jgi:cell division protein FtsL
MEKLWESIKGISIILLIFTVALGWASAFNESRKYKSHIKHTEYQRDSLEIEYFKLQLNEN